MEPGPGEPAAAPGRITTIGEFARLLTEAAPAARPRIVAVDGRGGSGKTTLAERLAASMEPAAVVHSDDVAWWHSRFGWDDLMIQGVIAPLRAGRGVHYQPPGWAKRGRQGHIDVPAGVRTVFLEGVGVSRRSLAALIDVAVWVQSDYEEARRRGIARDVAEGLGEEEALREWLAWEAEEVPFLLDDRPWERARYIVAGETPDRIRVTG
jgi:hypothetical protein